jgi:hypothetical protein
MQKSASRRRRQTHTRTLSKHDTPSRPRPPLHTDTRERSSVTTKRGTTNRSCFISLKYYFVIIHSVNVLVLVGVSRYHPSIGRERVDLLEAVRCVSPDGSPPPQTRRDIGPRWCSRNGRCRCLNGQRRMGEAREGRKVATHTWMVCLAC